MTPEVTCERGTHAFPTPSTVPEGETVQMLCACSELLMTVARTSYGLNYTWKTAAQELDRIYALEAQ